MSAHGVYRFVKRRLLCQSFVKVCLGISLEVLCALAALDYIPEFQRGWTILEHSDLYMKARLLWAVTLKIHLFH